MDNIIIKDIQFSDINPITFGIEACKPSHSFGPYIRDFYLLHFVVKGKGMFYCPDGEYEINAGNIFVIRPHEVTKYTADNKEPWKYIWIGFNGNIAGKYPVLQKRIIKYHGTVFNELAESKKMGESDQELVISLIFRLLHELKNNNSAPDAYVTSAAEYIKSNYMKDLSVSRIASTIGLDRSYLSKLFSRQMNISMQEYIIKTKMKKAYGFLRNGYSVGETSALCGYSDQYVFSRAFKKVYGIPPVNLRKRNR